MPAESMPASPGSSVRGAKKKSPSDAARIILFRFPLSSFLFPLSLSPYLGSGTRPSVPSQIRDAGPDRSGLPELQSF
jgi:hypothetical protein